MITIKHIAERLDLSVSTVGRALADHPRISRETKDRVRAVAEELGYVANRAARMMRGGSSHLVGLLVPDIRSTFYSMVAQVLSKCVEAEGFHLALSITDDDRDTEMQQVRELVSARVAGIVLIPSANPRRETIAMLRMVPHVQILRRIPALGDCFGMDEEHSMLDATNHLLELGHRRIAYVGDLIFSTGRVRYDGFRRAHAETGCSADDSLVEFGPPNAQFGAAAISRLMASPNRADGGRHDIGAGYIGRRRTTHGDEGRCSRPVVGRRFRRRTVATVVGTGPDHAPSAGRRTGHKLRPVVPARAANGSFGGGQGTPYRHLAHRPDQTWQHRPSDALTCLCNRRPFGTPIRPIVSRFRGEV